MNWVDTTQAFKTVYALYHHEYLGYLISAHYVQLLPSGDFSLAHQGAHPENMDQYADGMDDADRELIPKVDKLSPHFLVKKYGGNPLSQRDFFSIKFHGEFKDMVQSFIQKQLAIVLPFLRGRLVFEMDNDGYPASSLAQINVVEESATLLFHFRRKPHYTRYYPTLKLRGEKLELKGSKVICQYSAWLYREGEIFHIVPEVNGKKLLPFTYKDFVAIPREREEEYYQKFVTGILEKYPVFAKGFEIVRVDSEPSYSLEVHESGNSLSFSRLVHYDRFSIPMEQSGEVKVELEKKGEDYIFYKIMRKRYSEDDVLQALETMTPRPGSISPWGLLEKDFALAWLADHQEKLDQLGVRIKQPTAGYQIHLDSPEIEIISTEESDWFDVKAIVKIGQFKIPLIKFRKHILNQIREYKLPDGTIAILPEHWFMDFRHMLEVSEVREDHSLKLMKYQATLLNLPSSQNGLSAFQEKLKSVDHVPAVPLPEGLNATLRNYQQQGYNWLTFMGGEGMGCILADDMGLGKTLQALALLLKQKQEGAELPSLIVMPSSLIHNWEQETNKFTPELSHHSHTGISRSKTGKSFSKYDLIFTTYGILRQDIDWLVNLGFNYVILDEAQMIKNPESKTSRAVRKIRAARRLTLTGTPVENSVMDIWSQMSFLNPGLLGSETFFRKFYVLPIEKEFNESRSAKLRRVINPFILRRKKEQVEKELPPRIENILSCLMEPEQEELYEETRSAYRNYLMKLIKIGEWKKNKFNILAGLQKLRQIAIHPAMIQPGFDRSQSGKFVEIRRMLGKVMSKEKSKVLIFSQFVKALHLLREELDEQGLEYNYLDGSTRDRKEQVESFQTDPNKRIFLISLKAGGVGLNLTAADYVFILDPWWNPAVENQAIDRSHRIGQERTVFFYKFITRNSIEEKILKLQEKKAKLSEDIITVEEDIYKSMDAAGLSDLVG